MLTLHLGPAFAARGIDNPHIFLVRNGFTRQMARGLTSGKRTNINLKYLERLCELLWCEPADLFLWQPVADKPIPEDHPLKPLMKKDFGQPLNTRKMLAKVPLKKVSGIVDRLKKDLNE